MKIFVKVKTGAKEEKIIAPQPRLISEEEEWYTVWTKERPVEGRANEAVTRLLAQHFSTPRSSVRLVSGAVSKRKVFEIK